MIDTTNVIYAWWCLSENFGDKLTPYIIEKISGRKCVYSPKEWGGVKKYMVTGSVLNHEVPSADVWGAGIADRRDEIPAHNIKAVRGYLSLMAARRDGQICDGTVGDPALLMPRLYSPKPNEKRYKIGLFPHYVDLEVLTNRMYDKPDDICIINPLGDIEEIIDTMNSCDSILSSSLHGLIVADAYGIPNRWVEFSDFRILGDKTKYYDYYSSIGIMPYIEPVKISLGDVGISYLYGVDTNVNKLNIDLDRLWNVCPFKPKLMWQILIPTINKRKELFDKLCYKINRQIQKLNLCGQVEILSKSDHCVMSIGTKRNWLIDNATAEYISFVDDDDDVSDDYVEVIFNKLKTDCECVSLIGEITFDGENPKKFIHSIDYTEYFEKDNVYYRPPNHLNPMKRAIAIQRRFPEKNFGEDTDWAMEICNAKLISREEKVEKPYYFYKYVSNK